jgi:hypothetical protein
MSKKSSPQSAPVVLRSGPKRSTPRYVLGSSFSLLRRHASGMMAWAVVAYAIHEISAAFIAFAGKLSVAQLKLNFLAHVSVVWTVSVAVSGLSITLYLRERRLHIKTRERLSREKRELELLLDPNRTSSALTPEGLTRKEDR